MYEVKIPQQGFTTEYVTLTKIYVAEGDEVKEGRPLFEMESDKATIDVESPVSGKVMSVMKQADEEANIGEVIMTIEV